MKNILLLCILLIVKFHAAAQSNNLYHLETEYTTQNGYRYYFDKLDPQSGISTRITQLPIQGFFTGYAFFNCFGNYVFQGIDSILPSGQYVNKLYELDTLGNVVHILPMDTANGTWYKACLPSAASPTYYALRWNITSNQSDLETINALTGTRTIQVLSTLTNYNYWNSDATITRDDILWFGMDNQSIGTSILISVNPVTGQVNLHDTLSQGFNYYYDCLNYNCSTDTIYGFISHQDSVYGSELLKIHAGSATVIHTGRTAAGTGFFTGGTHTRLYDGSFYMRTSTAAYHLPDFFVTAPMFILPAAPTPTTLSTFCFAAPRETCTFYTLCKQTTVESVSTSNDPVQVFPNPASGGSLNIVSSSTFHVDLIDCRGMLIFSDFGNESLKISTALLASGIYTVRITKKESVHVQKVIINN